MYDRLKSCDTFAFVVAGSGVVFGKNADRPSDEAHEVVHTPATTHADGATVRCTHITIPQVKKTFATVLSKPSWMWGCEIGANSEGVVGGNEAVSSLLSHELGDEPRLLGMDLLRLALERGGTARDAVDVLCALLETHGQGGPCEDGGDWTYENGFMIADSCEAFVVETAGVRHWAVECVRPGTGRNISNGLSIRMPDWCASGVQDVCRAKGWWDGEGDFDWKLCVGHGGGLRAHSKLELYGRERAGKRHIDAAASRLSAGTLAPDDVSGWLRWMIGVLRDDTSGICFRDTHGFMSTGSQVSWLPLAERSVASHLFTAASDPLVTCYKRFAFARRDECTPPPPSNPDPPAEAHMKDHTHPNPHRSEGSPTPPSSLQLWRRWRGIDLRGGLARVTNSDAVATRMRETMQKLEEAAIAQAVAAAVNGTTTSTSDANGTDSFAASLAAELALLESLESEADGR